MVQRGINRLGVYDKKEESTKIIFYPKRQSPTSLGGYFVGWGSTEDLP